MELFTGLLYFISVCLAGIYILSKLTVINTYFLSEKESIIGKIIITVIMSVCIMLTSKFAIVIGDARTNVRDGIAVVAAILGGPVAGLIVAAIGAAYRLTLGGWTTMGCCAGTLLSGIVSAALVYYYKIRLKDIQGKEILMFSVVTLIAECVHLLILVPWLGEKTFLDGLVGIKPLLLPMILMNVGCTLILLYFMKDVIINNSKLLIQKQEKLIEDIQCSNEKIVALNEKMKEVSTQIIDIASQLNLSMTEAEETGTHVTCSLDSINKKCAQDIDKLDESKQRIDQFTDKMNQAVEMTQHMKESSDQIIRLNKNALETVATLKQQNAENSASLLNVSDQVNSLGNKSRQIHSIIDTITQISTQTNLLALNASIEAARVGEQGKGFTIVAEEIGKLADATGKATGDIKVLIGDIQNEVNQVIENMSTTKTTIMNQTTTMDDAEKVFKDTAKISTQITDNIIQNEVKIFDELNDQSQKIVGVFHDIASYFYQLVHETESLEQEIKKMQLTMKDASDKAGDIHQSAGELNLLTRQ